MVKTQMKLPFFSQQWTTLLTPRLKTDSTRMAALLLSASAIRTPCNLLTTNFSLNFKRFLFGWFLFIYMTFLRIDNFEEDSKVYHSWMPNLKGNFSIQYNNSEIGKMLQYGPIYIWYQSYRVYGSVLQITAKRAVSCGTTENSPSHPAILIGG